MEFVTSTARVRRAVFVASALAMLVSCVWRVDAVEPADPQFEVSAENWMTFIQADGIVNGVPYSPEPRVLGLHPSASDGFDNNIDFVAPPPRPAEPNVVDAESPDLYFTLTAEMEPFAATRLLRDDFRGSPFDTVEGTTWSLTVYNPTVSAVSISWDMTGLDEVWTEASITDENTSVGISMREFSAVSVDALTTTTLTVRVRVNINEPPVFDTIADISLAEDVSTTVTLTGVDAGAEDEIDQVLTFDVSSDNQSVLLDPTLTDDGTTRSLTFSPVAEAHGVANVTVTVRDDGITGGVHNNTYSQTFSVTVFAVNDVPTIDGPVDQVISEDAGPQVIGLTGIGVGGGDDEATTQTLVVEAMSDNVDVIPDPVVTNTGEGWELAYEPVADANTDAGPVGITVTVTDDGAGDIFDTAAIQVSFVVDVLPVNDLPVAVAAIATTFQNIPVDIALSAADIEGDDLLYFVVTAPTGGSIEPTSGDLVGGEIVVTYTPDLDFSGDDTFTFAVNDGTDDGEAVDVFVDVVANEPPAVSVEDAFELTVIQGTELVIPLVITDVDSSEFTGEITLDASGGAATLAEDLLSVAYVSEASFEGQDTFALIVTDAEGAASDVLTVVVEVTVLNIAPTIEQPADQEVAEDSGSTTTLLGGVDSGEGESSTQVVTVGAVSDNTDVIPDPVVLFGVDGWELTYTPNADAVTADGSPVTVTVTVEDDGAGDPLDVLSVSVSFTVHVAAVNDAPTIDVPDGQVIAEDAGDQVLELTGVGVGGGDDEATTQTLTVVASSDNVDVIPDPTITEEGGVWQIAYAPVADTFTDGAVTIRVTVTDDGGGDGVDGLSTEVDFTVDVSS